MGGWDGQSCLRTEEEGLARQRPQEEGPMEAWGVRLRSPIRSWSSAAPRDVARCKFFVGTLQPPQDTYAAMQAVLLPFLFEKNVEQ